MSDTVTITVPHWFLAALLAIMPTWWYVRARRRHIEATHRSRNQCLACGYDLRATPDRCPECGKDALRKLFIHLVRAMRAMTNPRPAGM